MSNVPLHQFIVHYRDELIRRCDAKQTTRSAPTQTKSERDRGVPRFLDQLVDELRHQPSQTDGIVDAARQHGHDLLLQGFTVSEVVHRYGDVCQSVTTLAVELDAPISTEDFRTLNRCLDDAIAGAVTEHALDEDATRDDEWSEVRRLLTTALAAFEVLQTGRVGIAGRTASAVHVSLTQLGAIVERHGKPGARPAGGKPLGDGTPAALRHE